MQEIRDVEAALKVCFLVIRSTSFIIRSTGSTVVFSNLHFVLSVGISVLVIGPALWQGGVDTESGVKCRLQTPVRELDTKRRYYSKTAFWSYQKVDYCTPGSNTQRLDKLVKANPSHKLQQDKTGKYIRKES